MRKFTTVWFLDESLKAITRINHNVTVLYNLFFLLGPPQEFKACFFYILTNKSAWLYSYLFYFKQDLNIKPVKVKQLVYTKINNNKTKYKSSYNYN